MALAASDLEETRRIILQALGGRRAKVYLFGSRARGDVRRYSDIDVGILPLDPVPAGFWLDLAEKLDNSEILFPVDLVDLSTAPSALRDKVLFEGILWNG